LLQTVTLRYNTNTNNNNTTDVSKVLPVLTAMSFLAVMELGADGTVMSSGMRAGLRALSVAMAVFTQNLPAGVFVYWNASNVYAVVQVKQCFYMMLS
jgi:membrane protein insertase Oxa1/YidC/SpoIIIJ